MQFKLDENLAHDCADALRAAGHDALTVGEQAMSGVPKDALAAKCRQERRILVTADLDLSDMRQYPPGDYAGHIVLRLWREARPHPFAVMQRIVALLGREPIVGRHWVVDESRVRMRGG